MPVSWVLRSILQAQYVLGSGHWQEVANEVGARQRDSDEDAQPGQTSRPPNPADTSPPTSPRTRLFPSEAAVVFAHLQKGSMAAPFWAESGHGLFSLLYCARKEIIAMKEHLTAVFQQVPEGYIAFVEELPGANTQGDTLDEARTNLQEAVQLVLESNRALAEESLGSKTVIREHLASIS